jgi:hypothetical protein
VLAVANNCEGLRVFHGAGSVCGTVINPIACCAANFNRVDGLEVQDVFDYLSAWFAHDMAADFNRNGVLNVDDVFAFMAAWHAGCR